MNTTADRFEFPVALQQRYRDNLARHVLGLSLHLQSEIMNNLILRHGHTGLRINFEPYISMAAGDGIRLSDIADVLGISRQAANQTVNQVEAAGYIQRRADPADGRAKRLVTTRRGRALLRDGARESARQQAALGAILGKEALRRVTRDLLLLSRKLQLLLPFEDQEAVLLPALLPRLADYISGRLQAMTMERGHPGLKRSFAPVLTAIGPSGGRIRQIARTQDVSKQAVSAVVTEIEQLGYIWRQPDPADPRQLLLRFTPAGVQLISDSVQSLDQLESQFAELVGERAMQRIRRSMAAIYRAQDLEEDVFGQAGSNDIRDLARELNRTLGRESAAMLGRLLVAGDPPDIEGEADE
jgi:DNA-binding MarR family transcriptional regulator